MMENTDNTENKDKKGCLLNLSYGSNPSNIPDLVYKKPS